LEANYQYLADMHNVISAHAAFIHENQNLKASAALFDGLGQGMVARAALTNRIR